MVIIMSLLEIKELTHTYGDNRLYRNAEFTLNKGEHIGIVGPNGAGKSTLIKICMGEVVPDTGQVLWQSGVSVGCLDQYADIDQRLTLEDFLKSAFEELYQTEDEMMRLYEQAQGEDAAEKLSRAAACQEHLERHDFYSVDTRIAQVAGGLGLSGLGLERPIAEMSGGQRAKAILGKLLLEKPDVLLLDEPTNFLDQEHISWLAEYLADFPGAFLVVSHDYAFLERVAGRICDIDNERLTKYYGSYSEFLKKKAMLREDYVRKYTAQQREIRKTQEFIRRNIAGRKSRMAKGRRKQLERMDKLEALSQKEIRPSFCFPALPLTNTEHLCVKRLTVGYHCPVLSGISFSVTGGQKVAVTGFNGIGKSTLLKTLTGVLPVMKGEFGFSDQVVTGYFAQEPEWQEKDDGHSVPSESSASGRTPIQIVSDACPDRSVKEVRRLLARCGISDRHAAQPVGTLSGGEQAKVKLCLMTLVSCNFLILDEPTNHLDVLAKEALKEALQKFPGTVMLVSHEEEFYKGWVQKVIRLEKCESGAEDGKWNI